MRRPQAAPWRPRAQPASGQASARSAVLPAGLGASGRRSRSAADSTGSPSRRAAKARVHLHSVACYFHRLSLSRPWGLGQGRGRHKPAWAEDTCQALLVQLHSVRGPGPRRLLDHPMRTHSLEKTLQLVVLTVSSDDARPGQPGLRMGSGCDAPDLVPVAGGPAPPGTPAWDCPLGSLGCARVVEPQGANPKRQASAANGSKRTSPRAWGAVQGNPLSMGWRRSGLAWPCSPGGSCRTFLPAPASTHKPLSPLGEPQGAVW